MRLGLRFCPITSACDTSRQGHVRIGSCQRSAGARRCAASIANSHIPSQLASTSPTSVSAPPLPAHLHKAVSAARRSWLQHCVASPLVDATTNSRVHLYGTVHFAPHGGAEGLQELQHLIERLQPTVLAIEQPFDLAARVGLPYPELIHHLAALLPTTGDVLAGPIPAAQTPDQFLQHHLDSLDAASHETLLLRAEAAEQLQALLPDLAHPAKIGRDLLDPFEALGFYGGCDYVTRPGQLVEALRLFGFLPGLEYAALATAAQQGGVQVYSVDAPLRLQETWVAQLVSGFTLGEADLARRLTRDLAAALELLPPEYQDWDAALADTVRRIEVAARAAADIAAAAGGKELGQGQEKEQQGEGPSEAAVTAFKVSRAVAAATVPYERCHEAISRQSRLQPLKFGLFARRAKHLMLQVRDLCQRMTIQQVRLDAKSLRVGAIAPTIPGIPSGLTAGHSKTAGKPGSHSDSGGGVKSVGMQSKASEAAATAYFDLGAQPEKVVLAVVGRQYVPYIEEMWANERSVLWHGDVPRTFAVSRIVPPQPSVEGTS